MLYAGHEGATAFKSDLRALDTQHIPLTMPVAYCNLIKQPECEVHKMFPRKSKQPLVVATKIIIYDLSSIASDIFVVYDDDLIISAIDSDMDVDEKSVFTL